MAHRFETGPAPAYRMDITTEQLFDHARTHNGFTAEPVSEAQLRRLYDLMKWAPTSANSSPARIAFVVSAEAKEKLLECVSPGNVAKTRSAPVTAIIGFDLDFPDTLPKLFPHADARSWFVGKQEHIETTAFRNGSLQGGYFILAARALGLDCGPMSGFDGAKVDAAFWAGTAIRTNFLCNLGRGDPAKLFARSPRLSFEEACRIV
jgi:3-hydroxypropanoate dehydrogenase